MPYDVIGFEALEVPTALPFDFDTATPDQRLLELARLLENEQEWRDSVMAWDYRWVIGDSPSPCGTSGCAIGLAQSVWPQAGQWLSDNWVCQAFGMPADDLDRIFFGGDLRRHYGVDGFIKVTPGMVATAIREFVTNRHAFLTGKHGNG